MNTPLMAKRLATCASQRVFQIQEASILVKKSFFIEFFKG